MMFGQLFLCLDPEQAGLGCRENHVQGISELSIRVISSYYITDWRCLQIAIPREHPLSTTLYSSISSLSKVMLLRNQLPVGKIFTYCSIISRFEILVSSGNA